MENEKKANSSQNVLNVILVIICGAIMGLFVYDYINKNDQIAEYKAEQKKQNDIYKEKLERIDKVAENYKQIAYSNTSEGLVSSEENEKIKSDIARNVSSNLSPIMAKLDKSQGMTNDKLDKIMDELIALLEKEAKKSADLRKQMGDAIGKERAIEDKLQKELTETQKVVADLNGMVSEVKAKYIAAHEDDSVLGDVGRAAECVPKFVGNALTFDWWASRDKHRAEVKIDKKQQEIMDRYEAIGNPNKVIRRVPVPVFKSILDRKRRIAEPELININKK